MALSIDCIRAILPFLRKQTTEDAFQDMIACYFEMLQNNSKDVTMRTQKIIADKIKEQNKIASVLYNPYRNISMNHPLGDSDVPISDWMDFTGWREWDD